MIREEATNRWIIPAIYNTWNGTKCEEILKALKQEPCGDCISREEMWKAYHKMIDSGNTVDVYDAIKNLPPVTPAIKKGKWIISEVRGQKVPCCSIYGLGNGTLYEYTYCPNCGAKMEE